MTATIYINGVIGVDTNLLDVIKQVKAQSDATDFLVKIDSVGGYVSVGEDIYNYLVNLNQPVTTYTTKAYSVASMIFMAGQTRIVEEGAKDVLMIHLPYCEIKNGTYQKLSDRMDELKVIEDEFINFYSDAIQVDKETIYSLLEKETFLSADEAVELGFATQTQSQLKAVAILQNNEENNEQSLMNKLERKIDNLFNMLSGKSQIKAELILQDSNSKELVFADLDATDVPKVGDSATVEGAKADGNYVMPDSSTIVFEAGVITEIKEAELELTESGTTESETEVKAELIKEIMKWEINVVNTSFEVGEILKYTYEEVEYSIGAGEYEVMDGRKIITDADGKIIEVKDAVVADETPTEPAIEEVTAQQNTDIERLVEILTMSTQKHADLELKYQALAKQIGSEFTSTVVETTPTIKAKDVEVKSFSIKRK